MNASEYKIGAGSLTVNGQDIGGTTEEGIVVTYEPEVFLHKSGKYGSTPIKASLIGINLTIQVNIGESTKENLERALAGSVLSGNKVKLGGAAGTEITGHSLVLTPFDGSQSWTFRNVVPTSPIEIAYQPSNPRVYQATFTAMIDPDAPEGE